jgi:hypothetical protein
MPSVNVLPFDANLGYPQRQRVKIDNEAYDCFYRWNSNGFCVLKIVRVEDSKIVFNGKLCKLTPWEAKDPATYEILFTMLPYDINESKADIWVFW